MRDYSKLPNEIKQLKQWVCSWDNSKIPMRSYERRAASSSSPETWSTFQEATNAVRWGVYDHIGFVFADTGIVGIDIDVGYENGKMTALCTDIINVCKSYTEKSKSGRGVHILLKGELPFAGKNNLKGVEIYKSKRFFICTGNVIEYTTMIENQVAIDYVVAKYFTDNVRTNGVRTTVQRIYNPLWNYSSGKIPIHPEYPIITTGGRNIALTSLAGTMWTVGYSIDDIYGELRYVNRTACKPSLPEQEIEQICNSIAKYRR